MLLSYKKILIGGFFLCLSFFPFSPLVSQIEAQNKNRNAQGNEGSKLQDVQNPLGVYVLTIEVGDSLDSIWSWWGHTALLVRDKKRNIDIVFDYGVFESLGLQFLYDYLNDKPVFLLGVSSLQKTLRKYSRERRTIWSQQILAEPGKLDALYQKLLTNARPQNRNYVYHHYYNNCTTKVRDIIDEFVFENKLHQKYSHKIGEKSIRYKALSQPASFPPLYFILSLFVGYNIHERHSIWQDMILPIDLMQSLENYHYQPQEIPGKKEAAIGPVQTLWEDPNPKASKNFLGPWLVFGFFVTLWIFVFYIFPWAFPKKRLSSFLRISGWWLFYLPSGIVGLLLVYVYINNSSGPFGYETIGYNFHLHLLHPFYLFLPLSRPFLKKKNHKIWLGMHRALLFWTGAGIAISLILAYYALPALLAAFCMQSLLFLQVRKNQL